METLLMKSLTIFLFIFLLRSPCAFGDEMCIDIGNTSTDSLAPVLVDGSGQSEDFTVNHEVMLYCCFISKQPVKVKWYKDDIPLTTGGRYQLGENNQVLSIAKGSKHDDGAYRCEGSNQHGRQSWNITVYMHLPSCQPPTMYSPQTTVTVKKGESVTLTCIVQSKKNCGTSLPSFYWRNPQGRIVIKNSRALPSNGNNNDVRMILTIKHVKNSHTGAYKCITRNVRYIASSIVQLNVE